MSVGPDADPAGTDDGAARLVERHFSTVATCAGILGALGYVGRQAELAEALGDIRERLAAAQAERDAARAVLAPLLDDPVCEVDGGAEVCVFCEDSNGHSPPPDYVYQPKPLTHEPDCPVLRKDDILGRAALRADGGGATLTAAGGGPP